MDRIQNNRDDSDPMQDAVKEIESLRSQLAAVTKERDELKEKNEHHFKMHKAPWCDANPDPQELALKQLAAAREEAKAFRACLKEITSHHNNLPKADPCKCIACAALAQFSEKEENK